MTEWNKLNAFVDDVLLLNSGAVGPADKNCFSICFSLLFPWTHWCQDPGLSCYPIPTNSTPWGTVDAEEAADDVDTDGPTVEIGLSKYELARRASFSVVPKSSFVP